MGEGIIDYPKHTRNKMIKAIEKLITEKNVTEFHMSNFSSFEILATEVLLDLKKKYPHIKIVLVISKSEQYSKEIMDYYNSRYDEIIKIPALRGRIILEYLIDNSEFMICFMYYSCFNIYKLLEYAEAKEHITIYNLGEAIVE